MNLLDAVKSVLPWIGTALGGPLGGMAADFVGSKLGLPDSTVETVKQVLNGMPPEKIAELQIADHEFQLKLAGIGYDQIFRLEQLNSSVIIEVNKTMQAETSAEHWPSYSWRPFIGFMFGFYISSLWLLPLFHVTPVVMNPDIVLAIGGILGVASWFRGKTQADPAIQTPQVTLKG